MAKALALTFAGRHAAILARKCLQSLVPRLWPAYFIIGVTNQNDKCSDSSEPEEDK